MARRPIALLLPGQGSQYPGMAVHLYEREPAFAKAIDDLFGHMGADGDRLREDWLSKAPVVPIDHGTRAQPLLFAIDYAIAEVLRSRGIRPAVLLGHSIGELAAAALAGVYDLPGAAHILSGRCQALALAPAGGMLAVAATLGEVVGRITPAWSAKGLGVAAVNGPAQTVLAGPEEELADAERALRDDGLATRRVRAQEPWHSSVMHVAAQRFACFVSAVVLRCPTVPIRSGRTARTVEPAEALDPTFWARQMAEPVLFWPALSGLLADGDYTLVEAGPGNALSMPARRHPSVRSGRSEIITLLPSDGRDAWSVWEAGLDRLRA